MYVKKYYKLIYFFIILTLTNCATTKIISQTDPSFIDKKCNKILIFINTKDYELQSKLEEKYSNILNSRYNVKAIASSELFLMTRNYTTEDIDKILKENKIDSILTLGMYDASIKETYIPERTTRKGTINENPWGGYTYTEKTTKYGGYYISAPIGKFEAKLIDVSTGRTAWVGIIQSEGTEFHDFEDLFEVSLDKTLNKLEEEGFITKKVIHSKY